MNYFETINKCLVSRSRGTWKYPTINKAFCHPQEAPISSIFLPPACILSPHLLLSTQPPLSPLCLHLCITSTAQYPARATESLGNEMATGCLNLPFAIRHLIMRRYLLISSHQMAKIQSRLITTM